MTIEKKHFDALEFALKQSYPAETLFRELIGELPALIRAMQAENERLKSENDEYSRALKLSGGVMRKAIGELAEMQPQAAAPVVGGLSFEKIEELLPDGITNCGNGCGLVVTAAEMHQFARDVFAYAIEAAVAGRG